MARHDVGVSKPLWGDACLAMCHEKAAIAVTIVSAKSGGILKSIRMGRRPILSIKDSQLSLDHLF